MRVYRDGKSGLDRARTLLEVVKQLEGVDKEAREFCKERAKHYLEEE